MIELTHDRRGNKVLRLHTPGFSVPTLGNLPQTHQMDPDDLHHAIAWSELVSHVEAHGTPTQRRKLHSHRKAMRR